LLIEGKARHGIDMPARDIAGVVAMLLAAAMSAAKLSGQTRRAGGGASLAGMPCIVPTALGLSGGKSPEQMNLVVHAGMARFGIALTNPRELGKALLTASASEGSRH
jgi:hypothetical protein